MPSRGLDAKSTQQLIADKVRKISASAVSKPAAVDRTSPPTGFSLHLNIIASANMPTRFIDVAHKVEHGMITYKGMPGPIISDYRSRVASREYYAPGTEFHTGKIEMVANTGTYVDAPFHRYADGKDLSELPLESLADIPGIRINTDSGQAIDAELFAGRDLAGKAVLVHTGWSRYWLTEKYFENPPFLTRKAAEFLVKSKVTLVGIDSMNIDDIHDRARPAHSAFLKAHIPIVEHLTNLEEVPADGFRFFAVPVKIKSFGSFPVRAFAIVS